MFKIFFLKNGKWMAHGETATTKAVLETELKYLTHSLGLTANIFTKI